MNNTEIVLLGIASFIIIFTFIYWFQSRKNMKPIAIFDVVAITLFSALIFSRILSVAINLNIYAVDIWQVFNLLDKNFIYIGIFLGLIVGVLIIYRNSAKEKNITNFLAKVITSYCIAIIPLLLAAMYAGQMVGIEIENSSQMPLNIIRVGYNLFFLIIWQIFHRKPKGKGLLVFVYILLFSVIEFILRIFSVGYSSYLFNIIDLQQLVAVCIFIMGFLLFTISNKSEGSVSNYYQNDFLPQGQRRKREEFVYSNNDLLQTPRERFSLSYSKIQGRSGVDSQNRFSELHNKVKRRIKKHDK